MTIVVGLDFDGLIGNLRNYFAGGSQYTAWCSAIGVAKDTLPSEKPKYTDPAVRRAFKEAHTEPGSPIYLEPVPGALEEISALLDAGFSLPVVTARNDEFTVLAQHWLRAHGIDIPVHGTHKHGTKRYAIRHVGAIAHVDDTQHVLHDLRHDLMYRFLFSHGPYNKQVADDLHFVDSWKDLGRALRQLEKALSQH